MFCKVLSLSSSLPMSFPSESLNGIVTRVYSINTSINMMKEFKTKPLQKYRSFRLSLYQLWLCYNGNAVRLWRPDVDFLERLSFLCFSSTIINIFVFKSSSADTSISSPQQPLFWRDLAGDCSHPVFCFSMLSLPSWSGSPEFSPSFSRYHPSFHHCTMYIKKEKKRAWNFSYMRMLMAHSLRLIDLCTTP